MSNEYAPDNVRVIHPENSRWTPSEDQAMPHDAITHYELDARTEAIEARMDARIAHMESIVGQAVEASKEAKQEAKELRRHVTLVSWTVAGVTIAVIAVIMATATAWQTSAYSELGAHIQALSGRIAQLAPSQPAKK